MILSKLPSDLAMPEIIERLRVWGIDIAKQKFDVALLADGKIKNKTCRNSTEGFETLKVWLEKQGIQKVHACMEATGN